MDCKTPPVTCGRRCHGLLVERLYCGRWCGLVSSYWRPTQVRDWNSGLQNPVSFFSPLPTHWPVNFAVWWLWCTSFLKSCKHREENTGMAETQVISYSKFTLWIFWFRNQPLSLKCLRNSHTHCHFKLQRYFILNSHKIWHFKKKKKIPLINNKRGNYQSYSRHNV